MGVFFVNMDDSGQVVLYLETRYQNRAWSLLVIIGLVLVAGIFSIYELIAAQGEWVVFRWMNRVS